ncbi:hypothetical protein EDB84DRAFT_1522710 [Lactarius hengduanensis]|nr:hypothetical protein EDB84DRAFT_1522710 [Lactarius hengduanensis]
MLSHLALPTFILSAVLVAMADPTPSEPGPGDIFNEGSTCHIAWTPDASGVWKTLNIELMTGDNFNMVHLTTVATVDGTASPGTFDYPCPTVTLHSPVYFYQFTSPAAPNRTWTGRFAIADSTGTTVPPPNSVQPNGQPIAWGTGALADPSKAVPAPSYLTGSSSSTGSASSTSGTGVSTPIVLSTTGLSTSSTTGVSTKSSALSTSSLSSSSSGSPAASSGTSNPSTSTNSNSAGGLVVGAVSTRATQAGVALAVIAATFTFIF